MSESARKLIETLDKEGKSLKEIQCMNGYYQCKQVCTLTDKECLEQKGKWVSVETVTALLQKVFREKVMVSRKQLEEEKKEALEHVGFWRMAKQNDNSPPFSNEQVIARAKVCWIEELLAGSVEEGSK
jgi:hypothetical protein